ncbi:MAG: (2Fe-2S)-binding protein [Candidatus Coatesbacteria bacterium]|nr:(2Fe-2S)-binding protein [Candidatus Coatesbacteria bacterium]
MNDFIKINFWVNGKQYDLEVPPLKPLSRILREDLHLTGTKEGCREGECGACSVILNATLINSCLYPAFKLNRKDIITIEGLQVDEKLNPIQEAFKEVMALQCGFCTPGLLMAVYYYVYILKGDCEDRIQIKNAIGGNICRCTGYEQIIQAIESLKDKVR